MYLIPMKAAIFLLFFVSLFSHIHTRAGIPYIVAEPHAGPRILLHLFFIPSVHTHTHTHTSVGARGWMHTTVLYLHIRKIDHAA